MTCVKWLLLLFVAMRGKKKRIFCDFRFYFLIEKKIKEKISSNLEILCYR